MAYGLPPLKNMINKNCLRFLSAFLFAGLCVLSPVLASPPRDWNYLKQKPSGFKPCRPMSAATRETLRKKGAIARRGSMRAVIPSNPKILVIRVKFSDRAGFSTTLSQQQVFFSRFRDYFLENSYKAVSCSATLTNVYTLGSVTQYNTENDPELLRLKEHSINAALLDGVNFAPFDYIMIMHAGYGEEESRNAADLWSLFYDTDYVVSATTFNGFTIVPELSSGGNSPLGVVCHEFGHQLGLPDLYNTSVEGGISTCGVWSLMDYPYGYDNTGTNPPHLDPWCKDYVNFIDLDSRVVTMNSSLLMGDIETSGATGYYKLPAEVVPNEYFILEYRDPSKSLFDQSLPGSGVLIWHIDTAQIAALINDNAVNNFPSHPGIDLVEADSLNVAPHYPPGRAGNAFCVSNFMTPLSDTFSGSPTGITVTDFRNFAGYTLAQATKIGVSSNVELVKAAAYPNPAGKGYPPSSDRQNRGIITTIVFKATRPPAELSLDLYTLAGERLLTAKKHDFVLQLGKSSDYQWVYEYDWNGRNGSSENVAPGLYFYRIKADREVKTGKIAVIR